MKKLLLVFIILILKICESFSQSINAPGEIELFFNPIALFSNTISCGFEYRFDKEYSTGVNIEWIYNRKKAEKLKKDIQIIPYLKYFFYGIDTSKSNWYMKANVGLSVLFNKMQLGYLLGSGFGYNYLFVSHFDINPEFMTNAYWNSEFSVGIQLNCGLKYVVE